MFLQSLFPLESLSTYFTGDFFAIVEMAELDVPQAVLPVTRLHVADLAEPLVVNLDNVIVFTSPLLQRLLLLHRILFMLRMHVFRISMSAINCAQRLLLSWLNLGIERFHFLHWNESGVGVEYLGCG